MTFPHEATLSSDDSHEGPQPKGRELWLADPVRFISHELGARPWAKQVEIIESVRDEPRVAVRSCNGSGKTYVAAHVVLWWLMCFQDAMAITTAPTEHQVRDVLWREIRRAYRGNEDLLGGKLLRTSLELGDKHYAQGLSTDSPERFQGFHEGHILFVVDEASGVREGIFEAIEGSMTSEHARMLMLGNPTALSGYFYEAFHRRRSLWKTIHISAFDTPNVAADRVVMPSLVTPKWVRDSEVNWGRDSPMYQIRVLGDFPSEAEDTLIPLRLIEEAINRHISGAADTSGPVEAGVDVARFGSDRSVICVRQGERVIEMKSFQKQDTMQTAGQVMEMARMHSPTVVRVDEIGMGSGVLDRLKELGLKPVKGVNVARRSSRPEHFANQRVELYDGLRERFQQGRIAIPNDPKLVSELASIKYSFTSSGQVRLEDKEDLRARGRPSPDMADALMLAFATADRPVYRIWT